MCHGTWHGIADLLQRLEETKALLTVPDNLSDGEKRTALETAMANLIAIVDWFEWANRLTIDPQRVEAEFDRYDERLDSATERERPFA
jgi:hypothetical protein